MLRTSAWMVLICLAAAPAALAEKPFAVTEKREACREHDPVRRPFFGDTHVHTTLSFDARSQDTRNTPRDAYRFAKGEEVGLQPYDASGKPLLDKRGRRMVPHGETDGHRLTSQTCCADRAASWRNSSMLCHAR